MIYIGNIKEVLSDDFIVKCKEMASVYKNNGRSDEDKLKDTIIGEAVEQLVIKRFNFKEANFEDSWYDAEDDNGFKYEIKKTSIDSKWWNFGDNYNFFFENIHRIDYIILSYFDKTTGDIYLKYKANAKSFEKFKEQSKYNSGYYYNTFKAISQKECEEF